MAAFDFVLDQVRWVVIDLDAHFVQVELVSDDLFKKRLMSTAQIELAKIQNLHWLGHQG